MDLKEVEWGMAWADLVKEMDRFSALVNTVTNSRVP